MNNLDLAVKPERFYALVNVHTGYLYKAASRNIHGPSLYKTRKMVENELSRLRRMGYDNYEIVTVEIKGVLL